MNTKHLMKKLPSCLLGAILAAGIASSTTVNAVDGNPTPGLFELEGNTTDDSEAGTDWNPLYTESLKETDADPLTTPNYPANLITFTGITADPAPTSIYWKGGSKDINDVNEWWYKDGSVPDKDDITNAYAAAFSNPTRVCVDNLVANNVVDCGTSGAVTRHAVGDLIIYFGLDRYSNDGDAFAGFWFFQKPVATDGNNQFTGVHKARDAEGPGDMLILVEYPQASNAVPEIKIYEWVESGGDVSTHLDLLATVSDAECDDANGKAKVACAITNLDELTDAPAWPYTPKSGNELNIPFESFFEGGVNVTQLLGSTPCFASFLAETRASRSETATLKDFVIDEFPVCGIDVEKNCTAKLNTAGTGVDVTFDGVLENTGGSSYIAYLKDDQAGSKINRVCVDTNAPGCADNADVAGLVLKADGSAYFPLAGKALVRYEGSYSESSLVPNPLTDKVIAEAYAKAADIGTPTLVIIADDATATCNYQVNPTVTVTKNCVVAALASNQINVTIKGTVTNGDVPLTSVTLVDNKFGAITFPVSLAKGEVKDYEVTKPVSYASLSPVPGTPDANGLVTVSLTHTDEVTVSGKVFDTAGTEIGSASNKASATCPGSFTIGVDVQKDCDVFLDFSDVTGRIVVRVDVTATVTNLGSENLTNLALTDDPLLDVGFKVGGAAVPTSLAVGGSFIAKGSYFPGTTAGGGTNPNPGLASFTDTVDVTAKGAFSALSATDENTAVCDLCPPVDAH